VRQYAAGHAVAVLGTWVQQTALAWLVYRLTGSVFMLGVMGFLLQIPFLLLGPFTGRFVDRMPKLPLLIAIDVAISALSCGLALMAYSDVHSVPLYLAAAVLLGSLNAFEMPARQSLLARIVEDRALMPSALGVSATLFNGGRMIGPALAGAALLYVSEAWCFLFNAISNLGIIVALLAMRLEPEDMRQAKARVQPGIISSFATLWSLPPVRILVPLMAVVGLFGVPYIHLMPSIAADFFQGSASTFGLLMSAAGLGALTAAATISMQRGTDTQRSLIALAPAVLGIALALFAMSRSLPVSFLLLVVIGGSVMCCANSANVLLQQSVSDEWRGRVIGLYAMSFQGIAPVGTLLSGFVASHIGLSATLLINGIAIAAAGLLARHRFTHHPEIFDPAARMDAAKDAPKKHDAS
jgi:MFS family permease